MLNAQQDIHQWLKTFEQCVRKEDYARAKSLFHPDCYCFGTKADKVFSLEELMHKQWREIWSNIEDFGFNFELLECRVSHAGDMATAICPWHSTGFHTDGRSFPRLGRVTIVLLKDTAHHAWLAYHTHFSLNPGTPQKTQITGNRIRIKELN